MILTFLTETGSHRRDIYIKGVGSMTRRKNLCKKLTAGLLAAAMINGTGGTASLLSLPLPDTSITASAASDIFSESRTLKEFMKGTAESEAGVRAELLDFSELSDYEELGYSVIYSKDLETNYIILYNGAHADFRAALMTENGQKWAKTYAKYLTTLYQLSGSNRDGLIVVFNTDVPSDYPGVAYGDRININFGSAFETLGGIVNNTFTWCILHETSHCFSGNGKGLANTMFNSEEDVYTNVRLTCAFHLMGLDTKQIVQSDYTSDWEAEEGEIEDKYRDLKYFWLKDKEYDKYFPEGSVWWTDRYEDFTKTVLISVPQYLALASCIDGSEAHFFNRYANVFNTAAEDPVHFAYASDPKNRNNWMNTDVILDNWATITDEEWHRLYALNVAYPENAKLPEIGDEVLDLYYDYIDQCTETIRYSLKGDSPCAVKVTPKVQKWLKSYFRQTDGVYRYPGTVIQTLNMFDFMGTDIYKFTVFFLDDDDEPFTSRASDFYSSLFIDPDNRGYTLLKTEPPITEQPGDTTVPAGDTAKFSVKTSSDKLSYKWQFNDGNGWKDSDAAGYNTAALSVTANPAWDGRLYRCTVTYPNGEYEISESAKLNIGVKITKQPVNAVPESGKNAVFTVAASGAGTLSYQWQYNEGDGWKNSSVSGAKTASISVEVNDKYEGIQYRCVVTSSNGTSAVSDAAAISFRPVISKQPENASVEVGKTAVFSVAATGAGTLSYQWQYSYGDEWKNSTATGAKTASMSVSVKDSYDGLKYRCIVSSSNGTSVTSSAASVKVKAGITKQPQNAIVEAGKNAVFSVTATGAGTLSYQWQYNEGDGWKNSTVSGAKTASISVEVNAKYEGMQYRCIVTSSNGTSVTSSAASVKVKAGITKQPEDVSAEVGKNAEFTVNASGAGTLTYQWQYSYGDGWKDSTATGAKTNSVIFNVKDTYDGIKYRCVVTSSNGTSVVSDAAALTVKTNITKQPQNATVEMGKNAVFSVTATGGGTLSYQWQYNDGSGWKDSTASGAKTASIIVEVNAKYDGIQYRCIVTSSNGTSVTSSAASVKVKTSITKQPQNATVEVGKNAVFSVAATGAGTLSYQWQYNDGSGWKDSDTSEAKTASISVEVNTKYEGIQYRCIVTSSNGTSVTSSAASIKVKTSITKQPQNSTVEVGKNAVFSVTATGAGTLSYQWQYNDGSGWKNSTASGAKTASIAVGVKDSYDGLQYRCVVTSSNGTSATSDAAVIKVSKPAGKKGDANSDGKVNVADAVAVLQYIANKEKYPLTDEERENADCDGVAGITGGDAIAIQKADAGILDLNKV